MTTNLLKLFFTFQGHLRVKSKYKATTSEASYRCMVKTVHLIPYLSFQVWNPHTITYYARDHETTFEKYNGYKWTFQRDEK